MHVKIIGVIIKLLMIKLQKPKDVADNGKREDDKAVKRSSEDKEDRDSKRRYASYVLFCVIHYYCVIWY